MKEEKKGLNLISFPAGITLYCLPYKTVWERRIEPLTSQIKVHVDEKFIPVNICAKHLPPRRSKHTSFLFPFFANQLVPILGVYGRLESSCIRSENRAACHCLYYFFTLLDTTSTTTADNKDITPYKTMPFFCIFATRTDCYYNCCCVLLSTIVRNYLLSSLFHGQKSPG